MKLYLDSSAIVKLVKLEPESSALRRFLKRHRADGRVTSSLARVEVVRAVAPGGAEAVAHARRQLARIDQLNLDPTLLDAAAALPTTAVLRSLDAIHIASALAIGADLRAIVTYDERMTSAAAAEGMVTEAPA